MRGLDLNTPVNVADQERRHLELALRPSAMAGPLTAALQRAGLEVTPAGTLTAGSVMQQARRAVAPRVDPPSQGQRPCSPPREEARG